MQIITGNTRIEKSRIANRDIYFKREDQNPSGSFKDRLLAHIWSDLANAAESEIVTSSSGNFAISLLYFIRYQEPKLVKKAKVFIKDNLPASKRGRLEELVKSTKAELVVATKPKSAALQSARQGNAFYLRGSAVDSYAKAYEPIAHEIAEYETEHQLEFDAVIICCSSGTAAQGMMQGLLALKRKLPTFIVQTTHIFSIAKEFDKEFNPETGYEERTVANAIADRIAKRKNRIVELLDQLKGSAVIVNNAEIEAATGILNGSEIDRTNEFTGNAALSLAGMFKLEQKGYNFAKPLVIISGN